MGSESDRERMEQALPILQEAGVPAEVIVSSAHRDPDGTAELARTARERGFSVIICGAGLSAALPGVVAAHTKLPVIGVPLNAALGGLDALLSAVQMPPGVPV
ncbi:MAG: AIR carboxylase family protein, partial [Longimicrobiales bacterium]